jgi:phosphomethylpyrimidine synthase
MNAPDRIPAPDLAPQPALTREPFPAARKAWIVGSREDLRVPVREVSLSNGETVTLYDTSGPYTDPAAEIDVRRGLPDVRTAWIDARADTERYEGRAPQVLDDGGRHDVRRAARAPVPT